MQQHDYKKDTKTDRVLDIEASQHFMDIQAFFESVKGSLEKYFDTVEVVDEKREPSKSIWNARDVR